MRLWAGGVECARDVWSSELEKGSVLLICVDGETVSCRWAEGEFTVGDVGCSLAEEGFWASESS